MNATLPAGDRGHRGGDPRGQSRSAGVVPGALGLVYRVENPSRRGTPPGRNSAARSGWDGRESGLDGVGSLAVLDLDGYDGQAHLFTDGPREEATDGVCLPGKSS